MRAVNLIPLEERHGRGSIHRSGGGIYLVLAGLAGIVLLCALWTKAGWEADAGRAETGRQTAQAVALEAQASGAPRSQVSWAALRDRRLTRVGAILDARFDWSHALRELARVLPADVDVTSLEASLASGDDAPSTGLRGSLALPAFALVGCAQDHDHVMSAVSALRAMDGVQRVTLERSTQPDGSAQADAGSGAATAGCRPSTRPRPTFSALAFFAAPGPSLPATATATTSEATP